MEEARGHQGTLPTGKGEQSLIANAVNKLS